MESRDFNIRKYANLYRKCYCEQLQLITGRFTQFVIKINYCHHKQQTSFAFQS